MIHNKLYYNRFIIFIFEKCYGWAKLMNFDIGGII